jgi:hypothetical protein
VMSSIRTMCSRSERRGGIDWEEEVTRVVFMVVLVVLAVLGVLVVVVDVNEVENERERRNRISRATLRRPFDSIRNTHSRHNFVCSRAI